jgi:hypothetical protein
MKQPPPIPELYPLTTPRVSAAATAASTALPPFFIASSPAWLAMRSTVATAPWVPMAGCERAEGVVRATKHASRTTIARMGEIIQDGLCAGTGETPRQCGGPKRWAPAAL